MSTVCRYNSGNTNDVKLTLEMIYRAFPSFSKVDKKWEIIMPIMFSELFKHPVVFTPVSGGQWILPRAAVFNTLAVEERMKEVLLEVLATGEVKVATVPEHMLGAIKSCCHINLAVVTPSVVSQTYKQIQGHSSLSWDDKQCLLKYLLQNKKYELLEGLELLPLANGGFTKFCYNPKYAMNEKSFSQTFQPFNKDKTIF